MVCDLGILGSGVQRNGCRLRHRPFGVSNQSWLRRGTGMPAHRAYRVVWTQGRRAAQSGARMFCLEQRAV